jgi:hypothetical protein
MGYPDPQIQVGNQSTLFLTNLHFVDLYFLCIGEACGGFACEDRFAFGISDDNESGGTVAHSGGDLARLVELSRRQVMSGLARRLASDASLMLTGSTAKSMTGLYIKRLELTIMRVER